jgi:hypothetical protein
MKWMSYLLGKTHVAHTHAFGPPYGAQAEFEHADVGGGSHTTFIVLTCTCGDYQVFPQSNYDLTTPEWRAEFKKWAEKQGLKRLIL